MGGYYNMNLLLLTIILAPSLVLIPIVFSKLQDSEIACLCSNTISYYPHSNYTQSLLYLVDNLCANTPINNGFHKANWSEGDNINRAYGLASCRGDVSNEDCKACLVNATISVNNNICPYPYRKGAIIWRDYCQLKYSDVDFLGIYDKADYKYSRENVQSKYILPVSDLLSNLINNIDEKTLFGLGSTTVVIGYQHDNISLYGMVQCTRDLSKGNCKTCLEDAINEIRTDKVGAILLYGSCNLRYETYQFINN